MFTLFSHVGIVVADLDAAVTRWTDVFGLSVVERLTVEEEGIRSVMLSTGGAYGETTCVELISPLDPADAGGAIARRLAEHGEGVFHLAFRVGDAADSGSALADAGLRSIGLPPAGGESAPRVVVHPRSANGVLLELLSGPGPHERAS